jgi:hypothetical protein
MTGYTYTEVNCLEKPHKYTYTPYLGIEFVDAYFRDRLKNIRRFKLQDGKSYKHKIDSYFCHESKRQFEVILDNAFCQVDESWRSLVNWEDFSTPKENISAPVSDKVEVITSFDIENEINTEKLLSSLIFTQLNIEDEELIKEWLDRLVQRFEVTKKLYETYPPGFRKGKGRKDEIRLYWLFSLLLTLYYASTTNIKYLSALLKVSDLLCSLSDDILVGEMPLQGLSLTLSIEFLNIKLLSYNVQEALFE